MKTPTFLVISMLVLMISCSAKTENGDGEISFSTTKEVKESVQNKEIKMNIDEIKVSQSIRAEVIKSDEEKVVISAPSDIIDEVLVDNRDGKLSIHFKSNVNISSKNVSAKIYVKDFSRISADSSADIVIKDKFTQEKIFVDADSSGSITGDLEANELDIDVDSSGGFSGKIWAVNLKANADSSGDIKISGKTKNADLQADSSGNIDAKEVVAENAKVEADSSGGISLSVSGTLDASADSSGSIEILKKGNLKVVKQESDSGGRISVK